MNQIRIRCSSLGKIMTSPKSGVGLSETAKTYIRELFLELEFGIRKEFWSKYTDKGIRVEKESIRLANQVLDWGLTDEYINREKQEYFENDWISGMTDVCTDWLLADIKSSWDGTTFPFFLNKMPTKDYYYQLQGYMWLTGHDEAQLVYCLTDTPKDMVNDEIRRELWKHKKIDNDDAIEDYVIKKHSFDRVPLKNRIKHFTIKRDESLFEKFKERITQCREYYDTLYDIL
jgi:hypothetical protein